MMFFSTDKCVFWESWKYDKSLMIANVKPESIIFLEIESMYMSYIRTMIKLTYFLEYKSRLGNQNPSSLTCEGPT